MGKLRSISPAVRRQPARVRGTELRGEGRDKTRDMEQPWRAWYKTARWQALRARVIDRAIARDGCLRCCHTGVALTDGRDAPHAAVVDHIEPHRGDPALFWNEANLQVVCKAWHDREKQRIERRG